MKIYRLIVPAKKEKITLEREIEIEIEIDEIFSFVLSEVKHERTIRKLYDLKGNEKHYRANLEEK
jgi:hypothetical protein